VFHPQHHFHQARLQPLESNARLSTRALDALGREIHRLCSRILEQRPPADVQLRKDSPPFTHRHIVRIGLDRVHPSLHHPGLHPTRCTSPTVGQRLSIDPPGFQAREDDAGADPRNGLYGARRPPRAQEGRVRAAVTQVVRRLGRIRRIDLYGVNNFHTPSAILVGCQRRVIQLVRGPYYNQITTPCIPNHDNGSLHKRILSYPHPPSPHHGRTTAQTQTRPTAIRAGDYPKRRARAQPSHAPKIHHLLPPLKGIPTPCGSCPAHKHPNRGGRSTLLPHTQTPARCHPAARQSQNARIANPTRRILITNCAPVSQGTCPSRASCAQHAEDFFSSHGSRRGYGCGSLCWLVKAEISK
ncbi:hypothetical protein C8R43DRAFT_1190206, partial [Mycena crocata]